MKLLEEVRLVITAVDQDNIATSTEVTDFKLFEDRESVHEFRVPARLQGLSITLFAKVKSLSLGKQIDLAAGDNFRLNGIGRTDKIEDLHLAKFGDDYAIELLGRTGEAKADRPVSLSLKHREFRETVNVLLKSDAAGRIKLGELKDIATITANGPEGTAHTWSLPLNQHTYRRVVHAKAGEAIALPYLGVSAKPLRSELALFEMRGSNIQADRFDGQSGHQGEHDRIDQLACRQAIFDLLLKETGEPHPRPGGRLDPLKPAMCWASCVTWNCRNSSRCRSPA